MNGINILINLKKIKLNLAEEIAERKTTTENISQRGHTHF